ncbi:MAG: Na+/H+ antiporter subunit E, partial [Sulfurimicrobium sp.]|nr:Na+/H+ antiporter subunit E [Sulfurimicrobium sp.]
MNRLLPHPILTPMLALVWLLLNNSMAPGQIVLGLLLGWAIPLFTLPFWPEQVRIRHRRTLLRFSGVVLLDILLAN